MSELFRIGPGYVRYWMHEGLHHWNTSDQEVKAIKEVGLSIDRLIKARDEVETARRAFVPASSLQPPSQPQPDLQRALFDATSTFYLTFYSALSALNGFAVRFRGVFPDVPHASNTKFLTWLKKRALFADEFDVLTEARQFRAIIDHKAGNQPYEWATVSVGAQKLITTMLHGALSHSGSAPAGAYRFEEHDKRLPPGHLWAFTAPDEDRVLAVLATQMNALFPVVQSQRLSQTARNCGWQLLLGPGDPPGGYPLLAARDGVVTQDDTSRVQLSEEDAAAITAIFEKYQTSGDDTSPR